MENIKGTKTSKLPFELNKRGDLISFESPLLSHFYDEKGSGYLLNWLDSDETINRWLLFEIQPIDLYDYFLQKKSLRTLIKETEEIVYFIDIDNDVNFKEIVLSNKNDIPNNYLPEKDSFYEELIATKYAKNLKNEITDTFSKYNIKNIRNKIKHYNSHIDDLSFISTLSQRNINNTVEELSQLKASYLPLLILHHHYGDSHSKGLKHLLHRHKLAYTNPFEYDSYFLELESLLSSKTSFLVAEPTCRYESSSHENNQTMRKLYSAAIGIVSQDPKKYKIEINLWQQTLKKDKSNQLLDDVLEEILNEK